SISSFMLWEGLATQRWQRQRGSKGKTKDKKSKRDESAFQQIAERVHRVKLWPMIALPTSGVKSISLWVILIVAFIGGVFSGVLGGGAGYIRMPSMVYILGVPTHLAVGTDLFEVVIYASYWTFIHVPKGIGDSRIALVSASGAVIV